MLALLKRPERLWRATAEVADHYFPPAQSLPTLPLGAQQDAQKAQQPAGRPWPHLFLAVFLPFVCGYFISYLFRTINGTVAGHLLADISLSAGELGALTAAYFLTFAAAQLPLGVALDHYGPRVVQAALLCVAALGALVFSGATGFISLFFGRALIGLGVAGALVAGMKANAQHFPKARLPLVNGLFIAAGACGAIVATTPVEWLLTQMEWRHVFQLLALATLAAAVGIYLFAPRGAGKATKQSAVLRFADIFTNRDFLRLAPLSTACIGSAWAVQSLWAARWLAEVALLDQHAIVQHLLVMAIALCAGALCIGVIADLLGRIGVGMRTILAGAALLLITAELTLILRWPLPPAAAFCVIGASGALTVLTFGILGERFPVEMVGRANGALNLVHIGGAFLVQIGFGMIVQLWQKDDLGRYPAEAYAAALTAIVLWQAAALIFFLTPRFVAVRKAGNPSPS